LEHERQEEKSETDNTGEDELERQAEVQRTSTSQDQNMRKQGVEPDESDNQAFLDAVEEEEAHEQERMIAHLVEDCNTKPPQGPTINEPRQKERTESTNNKKNETVIEEVEEMKGDNNNNIENEEQGPNRNEDPTPTSMVPTIHETIEEEKTEEVILLATDEEEKTEQEVIAMVVGEIDENKRTHWTPGNRMTRTIISVLSEACISDEEGVRYHWMIGTDEDGKDLERPYKMITSTDANWVDGRVAKKKCALCRATHILSKEFPFYYCHGCYKMKICADCFVLHKGTTSSKKGVVKN
jgi:hypothetical protein